jgi:hypothetical protein
VDIPTYLVSSVELATRPPTAAAAASGAGSHIIFNQPPPRPRLRIDLTKKKPDKAASGGRRTQWTVLCVAVTMMTMCVTLVGTMLSVGSEYQNNKVALSFAAGMREGQPPPQSSSSSFYLSSSLSSADESVLLQPHHGDRASPPEHTTSSPANQIADAGTTSVPSTAAATLHELKNVDRQDKTVAAASASKLLLALRLQAQLL